MKKLSTLVFGLAALATADVCAAVVISDAAGSSRLAERAAIQRASRLSNVVVTAIDERARTFTVAVVLSAADLDGLPAVGEIVDLTYGGAPGELRATTVKSGKSNSSDRAATSVKSGKSNSSERAASGGEVPRLSEVEVTAVDRPARTFTVTVAFSAVDLRELPAVGTRVDVTYSQPSTGGPLRASNLNLSKSNID